MRGNDDDNAVSGTINLVVVLGKLLGSFLLQILLLGRAARPVTLVVVLRKLLGGEVLVAPRPGRVCNAAGFAVCTRLMGWECRVDRLRFLRNCNLQGPIDLSLKSPNVLFKNPKAKTHPEPSQFD
jgi:hypothetical protein